jgi:hypothetical protein
VAVVGVDLGGQMKTEKEIRREIRSQMEHLLKLRQDERVLREAIQERQMFVDSLQWILDNGAEKG